MFAQMKAADRRLAIVLTTHAMDEADALCDRVAIMDQGRLLCEGAPDELKRALQTGERVALEIDRGLQESDGAALVALGAVNLRTDSGRGIEFQCRLGEGVGRRAAQLLETRGFRILHLTIAPVTLEDVFFSHTGRALRES
jgi:ABC-2 type transport system ATP-binding protein